MPVEYQPYVLIVVMGMLIILMSNMLKNIAGYYPKFKYLFKQRLRRKHAVTPERARELDSFVADIVVEGVDKLYIEKEITNDERYYLFEKCSRDWVIEELKPRIKTTPPWEDLPLHEGLVEQPKKKANGGRPPLRELFPQLTSHGE